MIEQVVVARLGPECQELDTPDFDGAVGAGRVEPLVVGGECQCPYPVGVAAESGSVGVVSQPPDLDGVVVAARVEPLVVGGERQRIYKVSVAGEGGGAGVVGQSPDLDGVVVAARVEPLVVGGERQRGYRVGLRVAVLVLSASRQILMVSS